MTRLLTRGGCVVLGLVGTAGGARAGYNVVSLADNTGPTNTVLSLGIANSGTVVVEWILDSGNNSIDVYGPGGRNVGFGGKQSETPYFSVAYPSINNNGQVSFLTVPYPVTDFRLMRDTAGSKETLRTFTPNDAFGNATSMNDSGDVAYKVSIGSAGSAIVRTSGGTIAQVGANGFTALLDPVMDNAGRVAFRGVQGGQSGIYLGSGGALTTVADTTGPIASVFTSPAINNAGHVAFTADMDAGGQMLYVWDGAKLVTVVDTAAGAFNGVSWASINDIGQVAVTGTTDAGEGGVWVMPAVGGPAVPVVRLGDSLFGSTVTSAFIRNDSLNDAGQVAFIYRLANGVRGVGLATPVPEIVGDTNGDGVVDLTDLNNVLNNFGAGVPGNPGDDNGDGTVDLADLNNVLNNFGDGAGAVETLTVVPEPAATTSAIAMASTLAIRRLRRTNRCVNPASPACPS